MKKLFKPNEGNPDRIIRAITGLGAILAAVLTNGLVQIVLVLVGIALLFTSLTGYCHLYTLLGISSCPSKSKK